MIKLHLDFETRSAVDIKKVGSWAYAEHPSTDVICMSYALNDEKPRLLTGEHIRGGVKLLIPPDAILVAHSAHFEYGIFNRILHRRHGWEAISDPKRWSCTLSRSVMCGLPASLEKAALAHRLEVKKDMDGRRALLRICKPIGIDALSGEPIFDESPILYQRVYAYCGVDVEVEQALDKVLPELSAEERKVWELDLVINRRGFQVDVPLAQKAAALAETTAKQLNVELHELTCTSPDCAKDRILYCNGVEKATQVTGIKKWIEAQGLPVPPSLDKFAVDQLLADPAMPQKVKDVLSIRRQVGKSSTAKFTATVNAACADGRIRGGLQYHAAATGRWGGRLVQPHNYPKGFDQTQQAAAIGVIMGEIPKSIQVAYGAQAIQAVYGAKAMDALSNVLRGTIIAAPGNELVVADFSAIESRVLLWLADDKLALGKYKMGVNLYLDMAKAIYQRGDLDKHNAPKEYAVGKAAILGAGYGMGPVRFVSACATAGIEITPEFAVTVIKAWREKYRTVVQMWYATERAALAAVKTPGSYQTAMGGRVLFGMDKTRRFLVCKLPSGRYLFYFKPSIKVIDGPRGEKEELHYWGAGLGGTLEEFKTYGGSLVENITQAVARDLMANGMLKAEAFDFPIVLTVHDELVAEIRQEATEHDQDIALELFIKLMCDVPAWADGCPVVAEGWIGRRYRK